MRWGTAKGNDDTVEGCLVVFSERVENGMMVVRSGDATMGRWGLASAGNGPVRGRDSVPQA